MELGSNGEEERWIMDYSSSHKILLVGEGDFSFAACLSRAFISAHNMIATSLDTKEELMKKHGTTAPANLKTLRNRCCTIIHNVDALTMNNHPSLRLRLFDRIVYNFPHSGLFGLCENQRVQIEIHKDVVRGFMRSARDMLTKDGEVHVTHKTGYPFSKWGIEELAKEAGLDLVEKTEFTRGAFPGYINKRGYGSKSNKTFRVGQCSIFKFAKPKDLALTGTGSIISDIKLQCSPMKRPEQTHSSSNGLLLLAGIENEMAIKISKTEQTSPTPSPLSLLDGFEAKFRALFGSFSK